MYAEPDSLCESGHIVSYVHRGDSVQKTTAGRHSQHLLLVRYESSLVGYIVLFMCNALTSKERILLARSQ